MNPSTVFSWIAKAATVLAQTAWFVLLVGALPYLAFLGMHKGLLSLGWSSSELQSFGVWWAVGAVCSVYWPWRYRKSMKGLWLKTSPHFALLSFTGPFALLFGIPV